MTSLSLLNSFLVLSRVNLIKATAIGMLLLGLRKSNNNIPIAVAFVKFTRDKTKKLFNKLKDVIFMELPVMPIKSHPQKRSRFTSPNTDSIFNVLDEKSGRGSSSTSRTESVLGDGDANRDLFLGLGLLGITGGSVNMTSLSLLNSFLVLSRVNLMNANATGMSYLRTLQLCQVNPILKKGLD